jgi:sulfate transport system ATP-binding protein
VGPIARLELLPQDSSAAGSGDIIEAQMAAQEFSALALKDGEVVVLTPRKARVFVSPT